MNIYNLKDLILRRITKEEYLRRKRKHKIWKSVDVVVNTINEMCDDIYYDGCDRFDYDYILENKDKLNHTAKEVFDKYNKYLTKIHNIRFDIVHYMSQIAFITRDLEEMKKVSKENSMTTEEFEELMKENGATESNEELPFKD